MTELIGKTPIIKLSRFAGYYGADTATLCGKLERQNPAGSCKDRIALGMLRTAINEGRIKPGGTVIEPTSGNTGIGLAACAAVLGLKAVLTMPDSMSKERIKLIAAYGAEIVLTPGCDGMAGAVKKAEELRNETENSIIAGQFTNPDNPQTHYETTGPEIWEETNGKIDIFIAGIGSGGTITGVSRYLKEKNPNIKIIAVEPFSSPLLSEGRAGQHGLQGLGANFVPDVLNTAAYDEIITITDEQGLDAMKILAKTEGIFCGISSGAAAFAAVSEAKKSENEGKLILCMLPDTGERYLSSM
ncbi:MAG: cysteine synthase A [Ruminococcaceae bacterium]|nr:cysteine synthase A [Oscillospiraceae bacterium]